MRLEANPSFIKSSKSPILRALVYIAAIASVIGIAVFLVLSSPLRTFTPSQPFEPNPIVLNGFRIPYYDSKGALVLLIAGAEAKLNDSGRFEISEPNISWFSAEENGKKEIVFSSKQGWFDREKGLAELSGGMSARSIEKTEAGEIERWRLSGESVTVDSKTGRFEVTGEVAFTGEGLALRGLFLEGRIDPATRALKTFGFREKSRGEFTP
ncbi:MAG: hypothetical protein Kow00107_04000 [Planctomycetota bacterium]